MTMTDYEWIDDWPTTRYESMADLAQAVKEGGGVLSLPMAHLRNAYGALRLGATVRANIRESLNDLGLATVPAEIPDRQSASVRIYDPSTSAGRLLDALRTPGLAADRILLAAAEADTMAQLRSILEARLVLAKVDQNQVDLRTDHDHDHDGELVATGTRSAPAASNSKKASSRQRA